MRSILPLLALLAPRGPGVTKLGLAEVSIDNETGELLVDTDTLRTSALQPTFGDDDLGDDDLGDDDLGDDDLGDDDLGDDDVSGRRRRRHKKLTPRERKLLRKCRKLEKKAQAASKGKVVERNVTVAGTVATSVGQAMSMTLTPRTTLHLRKIFATGDTSATITTIISGDEPVQLDSLDVGLLLPTAYAGPSYAGRTIKAGVPVTINYIAGSNSAALKLTFYGKARIKRHRC